MQSIKEPNILDSNQKLSNGFDLKQEIQKYTSYWYWFFVSIMIFALAAFLYLRYTEPQYQVTASVMITNDGENAAPELAAFSDLGISSPTQNKVENEILRFKSRTLMENVVKELRSNIQYFSQGRVFYQENYKSAPIMVNFLMNDSIINTISSDFNVQIKSPTTFFLIDINDNESGPFSFGESVEMKFGDMVITPNSKNISAHVGSNYKIVITPVTDVARLYRQKLVVASQSDKTSVVNLYLSDPVPNKAADIINTLIKYYNISASEEKRLVSANTIDFITKRLDITYKDLSVVDNEAESFKAINRLTNVGGESINFLDSDSQNEARIKDLVTRQNLMDYMIRQVSNQSTEYSTLPSNLGIEDQSLAGVVLQYNQLVTTRNQVLKGGATLKNPTVVNLDYQINSLRDNLSQSLSSMSRSIAIQLSTLREQNAELDSKITRVPGQEREMQDITRRLETKEQVYLYLLQKREEAAIQLAVIKPNSQLLDPAIAEFAQLISPKKKVIYGGALFAGLLIPFGILYLRDLLDTKVHTRDDIEKVLNAPIVGDIPYVRKKERVVISKVDRSSFAEAFRILRTNLDFLLAGVRSKSKTIFVTSTISGEGKTFVAANLAAVLAMTGKKVIFLGTDLRNPRLHEFIDIPEDRKQKGLSNFIMKEKLLPEDVIWKRSSEGSYDLITSGAIPPNPAELLMQDRVASLFEYLKANYDYIIVDTAPVSLVTDTILIGHQADLTLYLVRADYTDSRILEYPSKLYNEKRLPNMAILLNAVDQSKGYYGKYGYEYSYGNKKKKSFLNPFN